MQSLHPDPATVNRVIDFIHTKAAREGDALRRLDAMRPARWRYGEMPKIAPILRAPVKINKGVAS